MFSRLLVLVLILKDVFAIAEEIRPSPEPIYDFPINQDIFRMTNGTPGIGSVARQPPPGRLGIRQETMCPAGTTPVCTDLTFPCCDVRYPVCCPSGSLCCSSTSLCAQITDGTTICCSSNERPCPGGCCPEGTTCCDQHCCTSSYDCKPDSSGVLSCISRVVSSTLKSSRSATSSVSTEIASTSSVADGKTAQDADAKNKFATTIGIATGVSLGTLSLVVLLSLGVCLHKRRNKRKAVQGVKTYQNQTTADSPVPQHPQPIVPNALDLSQPIVPNAPDSSLQHSEVTSGWNSSEPLATVPPWATSDPSFQRTPTYHRSSVQTPMPPPYFEEIGTSASPRQPEQELSVDWGEKKLQFED